MSPTQQTIATQDGYSLSALYYAAEKPMPFQLLMAGATGVPQLFYRKFATFVAERGHSVLTFDFRGIGKSKQGPLTDFDATFTDWATLDLEAALAWALQRGPTVVVGHSFGGHAFGFLAQANQTRGLYTFGTGAGWHGYMPFGERLKARMLWSVLGPITTRRTGYLPSRRLGLGEDLPIGVYRQWKKWCGHPKYFFGDPEFAFHERFASVRVPIVAVSSTDDPWAPPRSRDVFMAGYKQACYTPIDIHPGQEPIGHMGYFRSGPGEPLWQELVDWLARCEPDA